MAAPRKTAQRSRYSGIARPAPREETEKRRIQQTVFYHIPAGAGRPGSKKCLVKLDGIFLLFLGNLLLTAGAAGGKLHTFIMGKRFAFLFFPGPAHKNDRTSPFQICDKEENTHERT